MENRDNLIENKIFPYDNLARLVEISHKRKSVLVGGCFDIIHYGHIVFLNQAKSAGDYLIVALEPDEFILKNKKRTPYHNQKERALVLANLLNVDAVLLLPIFESDREYEKLTVIIQPTVIAVVEGDPKYEKKKKQADLVSGQIKIVTKKIKSFSTSLISNL